jgi:PhnB protein
MAAKPVPEGYHTVSPYVVVDSLDELIEFLVRTFDAKEIMRAPGGGGGTHAEVRIGDSVVMIGQSMTGFAPTSASFYVYLADVEGAYRRALKAGASSLEEPADQSYGDRRAGVKDRFGNTWWIATHIRDVPH